MLSSLSVYPFVPMPRLQWWQWCALIARISFYTMVLAIAFGAIFSPMMVAAITHFYLDFDVQSNKTAANKADCDIWTVMYHSFITGGIPGLLLGGLTGLVLGTMLHAAIDVTPKFGLPGFYGVVADQTAHIVSLFVIVSLI